MIIFSTLTIHASEKPGNVDISIETEAKGKTFRGPTTISVKIELECKCVMPKLMVKLRKTGRRYTDPMYYTVREIQASDTYSETMTFDIPEVDRETEFELSVEVQDMDGDDLEDKEIEFYALPIQR